MQALGVYRDSRISIVPLGKRTRARNPQPGSVKNLPMNSAGHTPQDLNALLCAVGAKDRAAFEQLFKHFAPRVKSYILRLGSTDAAAEEIAQEVLVNVWRKAELYDPSRAAASTWIFTIARNLRIDTFRKENRPALDPNDPALVPDAPTPADILVEQNQISERIRQALMEMPDEQREVVHMSFFEDRTHAEISKLLAIPLGTVKSRIRLAFIRLKTSLDDSKKESEQ